MKEDFRGYYGYSDSEREELWKSALIVVDTNVLLDLYRQTTATRKAILSVLRSDPDRLWLPHQVALEFQRRRESVRTQATDSHTKLEKRLHNERDTTSKLIAEMKKYNVNLDVQSKYNTYFKAVGSLARAIKNTTQEEFDDARAEDAVLLEIEGLYPAARRGKAFKPKRLSRERRLGAERIAHLVPPGWADAATKEGDRIYGDYFVWRQTMDHARAIKRDVILVTNDTKRDWADPNTKKFHPELTDEFVAETGQQLLIYRTGDFVKEAKRQLKSLVIETEEGIAEAAREVDEHVERDSATDVAKYVPGSGFRLGDVYAGTRFNMPDLFAGSGFKGLQEAMEERTRRSIAPLTEMIESINRPLLAQISEIVEKQYRDLGAIGIASASNLDSSEDDSRQRLIQDAIGEAHSSPDDDEGDQDNDGSQSQEPQEK
ncbi:PIN domain-containing protein [Herbiconiux sp. VKM Ac-2851]|uniref:PIN domain-containing protein n=1 Tax=Herbiconiux sp. VKM Ac-2851 TaxID=2739025 RepID=UPI0015630A18|nr:PIN domain-containing protein [Herbiconiux sp. VKM Ac-2851]NQX36450.1 DUF4935 domain-containing protein [Herbiconiux sp. VKM Ac-2851]